MGNAATKRFSIVVGTKEGASSLMEFDNWADAMRYGRELLAAGRYYIACWDSEEGRYRWIAKK
jgi:hypothetical protein